MEPEDIADECEALDGRQVHGSALERKERASFVGVIATLNEHVRRLADQVERLGGRPCVEPARCEIALVDDATEAVRHYDAQLRRANETIDQLRAALTHERRERRRAAGLRARR